MNIRKLGNSILTFITKRLIEISGATIAILGVLLFLALISYSPEDPNFIFPENLEIKNYLGFHGSYTSDLFLQSVGLIAFLIPITFTLTGINMFIKKEIFLFLENLFFIIIYSIVGSLFFSYFYADSFNLYINGNGGFVGKYLNGTFLNSIISSNEIISYYILVLIIFALFFISLNFDVKKSFEIIKKISNILFGRKEKNYTNNNEIIKEYIPQHEIKSMIQEDLPFIKAENTLSRHKNKYKLPSLELLKTPSKNERNILDKNDTVDPTFIE